VRPTSPIAWWRQRELRRTLRQQIERVERYLAQVESVGSSSQPVLFFNASTRIHRLSLNGAFGLLASWAVRATGVPSRQMVCQTGMQQCVLGVNLRDVSSSPPCRACMQLSQTLYRPRGVIPVLKAGSDSAAAGSRLAGLPFDQLLAWEEADLPLGELCLPSLRWALRRNDLDGDQAALDLYRQFLVSGRNLADRFRAIYRQQAPRAVVVFNGIFFPEAIARATAAQAGIPVVTHEVGLRRHSAYFSHGEATFRQVNLPSGVDLTAEEDERLNAYLEQRFEGRFTMAGINFWKAIETLPEWLKARQSGYRQMVTVFTNVAFDTSQIHANTLFGDMFEWLASLADLMSRHPETLFILRAHPDENRPGKQSRQSVAEWARQAGVFGQPNVVFFSPDDPVSSYDLIRCSKLILVYNSSIGLEASILGAPVVSAGRARYTQVPTVYLPETRQAYRQMLEIFLEQPAIEVPESFARYARAFLYRELFHASLDFSEFLVDDRHMPGMVVFSDFAPSRLAEAEVMEVLRHGFLDGQGFEQ
jgi:hypothetical protein